MTEFYRDEQLVVHEGDCRAVLRTLPAESVHCVVTSPPYYGLRDYGIPPVAWGGDPDHEHVWGEKQRTVFANNVPGPSNRGKNPLARDIPKVAGQFCDCGAWLGQLGLEPHPALYIEHLVEVFTEVRRVLHPEGLAWLNLGDSFAAERGGTEMPPETMAGGIGGHGDDRTKRGRPVAGRTKAAQPEDRLPRHDGLPHRHASSIGVKHKDLIGVPWMAAFALRDDGWWLRRDVIWAKPNGMPESAEDRPASSHEYVFMLSRSERYFYDRVAVLEPPAESTVAAMARKPVEEGRTYQHDSAERMGKRSPNRVWSDPDAMARMAAGRNRRSVWHIATRPYKGAHFAVFPPALVETPIKASTSSKGACPECGAQWRRQIVPSPEYEALIGEDLVRGEEYSAERDLAEGRLQGRGESGMRNGREVPGIEQETRGWRPGCGHGWGGNGDDLDLIASPMRTSREPQPQEHLPGSGQRPSGQRGNRTSDIETTTRRGFDRERQEGEGRRIITRFEQRAYAKQLKAWDERQRNAALLEIADWLGKTLEADTESPPGAPEQPGWDAWRHYIRDDRRGARAIPPRLFDTWLARGWLTSVEPPDFSGALAPVPSVVLDPFGGSGTVGLVAQALGRRAILIDVNGEYLIQQMKRNAQTSLGMGL